MDFIAGTSPLEEVANYYFFQGTATVSASGTSALARPAGSLSGTVVDFTGNSTAALAKPAGSFSGLAVAVAGSGTSTLAKPAGSFSGTAIDFVGSGASALTTPSGSFAGATASGSSAAALSKPSGSFTGALPTSGSSTAALIISGTFSAALITVGSGSSTLTLPSGSATGLWAVFLISSVKSLWLPSPGGSGAVGASGTSAAAIVLGGSTQAIHAQAPYYGSVATYRSPYMELSPTTIDPTYFGELDSTSSKAIAGDYYLYPISNSIPGSAGQATQLPSPLAPHNSSGTSDVNSSVITPTALTQSFAAGQWLMNVPLYGPDNSQNDGQWQVFVNIWASTSTNGATGARLLTASGPASSPAIWPDTTKPMAQIIWNAPQVNLNAEYLIFDFALKCVSAPALSEYIDCWPMTIYTPPAIVSGAFTSRSLIIGGSAAGNIATFSFLNLSLPAGTASGLHGEAGTMNPALNSVVVGGNLSGNSGASGSGSSALLLLASTTGGLGETGTMTDALAKPAGSFAGNVVDFAGTNQLALTLSGSLSGCSGEAGNLAGAIVLAGSSSGLIGESGSLIGVLIVSGTVVALAGESGSSSRALTAPSGSGQGNTAGGALSGAFASINGLLSGLLGETGSSSRTVVIGATSIGSMGNVGSISGSMTIPNGSIVGLLAQVGGASNLATALPHGVVQGVAGESGSSFAQLAIGGLAYATHSTIGSSAGSFSLQPGSASGNTANFAGSSVRALVLSGSAAGALGASGSSISQAVISAQGHANEGASGTGNAVIPLAVGIMSGGRGVLGYIAAAALLVAAVGLGANGESGSSTAHLLTGGSCSAIHSIGGQSSKSVSISGSSQGKITTDGASSGRLIASGSGTGTFVAPLPIEPFNTFVVPGDLSSPFIVPGLPTTFVVPGENTTFVIPPQSEGLFWAGYPVKS